MNSKQDYLVEVPRGSSETQGSAGIVRRLQAWWNRQQAAQKVLALDPLERRRMKNAETLISLAPGSVADDQT